MPRKQPERSCKKSKTRSSSSPDLRKIDGVRCYFVWISLYYFISRRSILTLLDSDPSIRRQHLGFQWLTSPGSTEVAPPIFTDRAELDRFIANLYISTPTPIDIAIFYCLVEPRSLSVSNIKSQIACVDIMRINRQLCFSSLSVPGGSGFEYDHNDERDAERMTNVLVFPGRKTVEYNLVKADSRSKPKFQPIEPIARR